MKLTRYNFLYDKYPFLIPDQLCKIQGDGREEEPESRAAELPFELTMWGHSLSLGAGGFKTEYFNLSRDFFLLET